METYTFLFILILCLFLAFIGLYIPLIGFFGLVIAVGVIIPNVPLYSSDSTYMLFAIIVVIACVGLPITGYNRNK